MSVQKEKMIKLVNPIINYDLKVIDDILKSKLVTNGLWVKKLEDKICEIHNVKYAVATNSGTSAFLLLFNSLPFKPKKIVMPSFTWNSIKVAVKWLGVKVEWVDIDFQSWLTVFGIHRPFLNSKTLFMPTHTFGEVRDWNYTDKFNFIFDGAHCVGNKFAGWQGLGTFFSFSPAKATTGIEGGMVITNDESVYRKALELRTVMGRMSEINAYIAYNNLKDYKKRIKSKGEIYDLYRRELSSYGFMQDVSITNYNEIGFVFDDIFDKILVVSNLEDFMDIRFRYDCPELPSSSVSNDIRKRILMLPGNNLQEAKLIIKKIKEVLK